ncbi:hypothetical protein OIV83_001225 [Microbotryomycetes sp. JL201]|nr:hypothetical protein OIV83_001225 [Microbotryomycetes sp. JL201]
MGRNLGWGFTFSDACKLRDGQNVQEWDKTRSRFEGLSQESEQSEQESLYGMLYPDFVPVENVSLEALEKVKKDLATTLEQPKDALDTRFPPNKSKVHIYVCTHGTRDCRCGDLGEPLYQALVNDIKRRKLGGELVDGSEGVRVARVAHIGGHKFAGNALVFRDDGKCDWYGLLRASDASELIDYATAAEGKPWLSRWRGRLGMTSEQVKDAYVEGVIGQSAVKKRKEHARAALGDAVEIAFRTFEGEQTKVTGYEGESLMEMAKRHNLPSIEATCGGFCECATCHVIVPAADEAGDAPLPELRDEEDEQLEFAIGATDDSRLSCQIPVTKALGEWCGAGGVIQLPRY